MNGCEKNKLQGKWFQTKVRSSFTYDSELWRYIPLNIKV